MDASRKMSIAALSEADASSPALSSRSLKHEPYLGLPNLPQTPPDSTAGSPALKPYEFASYSSSSPPHSPLPAIEVPATVSRRPSVESLPSIQEFDQKIQELISKHGPARSSTWTSVNDTRPAVTLSQTPQKPLQLKVVTSPVEYNNFSSAPYHYQHSHEYIVPLSPESEGRHINQKYTTEQGDYIIYAWHDKKLKWAAIKEEFASMFGRTPERTVQGLQAWYYRMNKEIPVWDDDGWLIFEHEDAVEPKCVSIKRRQREVKCQSCIMAQGNNKMKKDAEGLWREEGCQCKQLGPLGLAQRYPERLVHYPWVDSELKRKARNWAQKRTMQYNDRRERRKRKELRRVKL
jgi:hypothetical protein